MAAVKWWLIGTAVILGLMLTGFLIMMVWRPFAVAQRVTDPDRVLYTYEWFFNKHAAVLTYTEQIVVADKAIETFKADHPTIDSYSETVELARLNTVAQGLRNQQRGAVNEYNAAAQNRTRGIFLDWALPACLAITLDGRVVEC